MCYASAYQFELGEDAIQSEAERGTGGVDDKDHGLLAGSNESLLSPL